MEVFELENYIYGNLSSQDGGDRFLPFNAPYPKRLRVQTLPSTYVADTTAVTPDGDTMDGNYFNEFAPAGR